MTDDLDPMLDRLAHEPPPELAAKVRARIGEVKPVKPLASPGARALAAAALGIAIAALVAWAAGVRPLPDMPMGRPVAFLATVAAATLGLWLAMRSAVPGSQPARPWITAFLLLPLAFFGVVLAVAGSAGPAGPMQCLTMGLIVSFLPWLIAMGMLWRGHPVAPTLTGAIAGMATGLYGLAMLHLSCPNTGMVHLMVFHGGVIVLASLVGAAIGRLVLSRSRG